MHFFCLSNFARRCLTAVGVAALSWSARAVDQQWKEAVDGSLNEPSNWNGDAVPGEGEKALFGVAGAFTVTADADLTTGEIDIWDHADVTFDLGNHTWSVSPRNQSLVVGADPLNKKNVGPGTLTVKSGRIVDFYALRMGNTGAPGNRVVLDGPNTYIQTGADDYYIGSNYGESTLIVTNGAHAYSGRTFRMGTGAGNDNTCIVTGPGTELVTLGSNSANIGERGSNNRLIIEQGGVFSNVQCTVGLGYHLYDNNKQTNFPSHNNALIVRSGATYYDAKGLTVGLKGGTSGDAGSCNTLAVSNATTVYRTTSNIVVGQNGSVSNTVIVADGATLAYGGHWYVGNAADSTHNRVVITGAGTTVTNKYNGYDLTIGQASGTNSLLIADGATVRIDRGIFAGGHSNDATQGGDFNEIEIRDPGTFVSTRAGALHLGKRGSNNRALITHGAVTDFNQTIIGGVNQSGYDYPACSNVVTVADGAIVTNVSGITIGAYHMVHDNALVLSNATVYVGVYSHINNYGTNNNLHVSHGGRFISAQTVYFGGSAQGGPSHSFVIGEGTVLTNLRYDVYVGNHTPKTKLTVADGAKLYASRNIYVGNRDSQTPDDCELILSNATATVIGRDNGGNTCLRHRAKLTLQGGSGLLTTAQVDADAGCTLSFESDATGLPRIDCTKAMLPRGTKLAIKAQAISRKGGGTFDIIRHQDSASVRSALAFDDDDDVTFDIPGCQLIRTASAVQVKIPAKGLVIFIR